MNTALTSQTPPTQPIRSLRPDTQGSIIGCLVGNVTSGDWSGGKKEGEGGGGGSGAPAPLCTLTDPVPRTGQEISRTKDSCHLRLTGSLRTKLLSADWQNPPILEGASSL